MDGIYIMCREDRKHIQQNDMIQMFPQCNITTVFKA